MESGADFISNDFTAAQIKQVALVRLPSVTHALNFDQQRIVLVHQVVDQRKRQPMAAWTIAGMNGHPGSRGYFGRVQGLVFGERAASAFYFAILNSVISKLILANLTQRPIRTFLSVLLIGIPVTLMLTLVGLSHGFVEDSSQRARGIGADIIVRSPDSRVGTVGLSNLPMKLIQRLEKLPHVKFGTGVASHLVSGWTTVSGIDPLAFERMSGKFVFREGHSFEKPDDILFDTYYAQQAHVHAGSKVNLLNREWNVAGIVEPGKLAHIFLPLSTLQELDGSVGRVAQIYLKLDDPANTAAVIESIKGLLPGYNIYSVAELVSLTSVDNVPFLRPLLNVIIGVAVLIGAAVASLSMYMAVQQRTREIGILKSLGASKLLIVRIILMEAFCLGLGGSLLGIGFSFMSRWLLAKLVPASLPQAIVPEWWPIAGAIAMGAAMLGALYPGILAARQDPIEALAYE